MAVLCWRGGLYIGLLKELTMSATDILALLFVIMVGLSGIYAGKFDK